MLLHRCDPQASQIRDKNKQFFRVVMTPFSSSKDNYKEYQAISYDWIE